MAFPPNLKDAKSLDTSLAFSNIRESQSPMLKQYHAIKARHKDCILFFRLGDFYEMFFEDAKTASRILDVVLTSRGKTPAEKIPMCGIPYHAADNYIDKLIKAGQRVAICEQIEDPELAKGIVKRDVVRIITSGTFLDENNPNTRYLLCLNFDPEKFSLAFIDPASGTIHTNQYPFNPNKIIETLAKLPLCECIFPEKHKEPVQAVFQSPLLKTKNITLSALENWYFNIDISKKSLQEHFGVHNLSGFGIENLPLTISSCGALLEYLKQMNKQPLRHIDKISLFADEDYVFISPAAYRGLELEALSERLDYTLSSLGKRKFRFWLFHPLKNKKAIEERQAAVKILLENEAIRNELRNHLRVIPDIEKSISRLSCGYTQPRDLLAIRNSLNRLPEIKRLLAPLAQNSLFSINDIPELREYLTKAVSEDIPLSHYEGKIIRAGFHPEMDHLRDLQKNGQQWLKKLQEEEIKRTGINSLKIGFTNVFGYYIEITNANKHLVPDDYIRKQTLVNGERFITPPLKEFEEKILKAEEKILHIEQDIIKEISHKILDNSSLLHEFCQSIATLDALYSLVALAQSPNYVLPEFAEDALIDIKEGRHPIVEKTILENFIPNDTLLDNDNNHLIILTGPNMAGKSTYIRQAALLVILSQMGSYIPAHKAHIGLVDKIFTRIGAHDDIAKGQSTFMVEMNETADIINNLTPKSLIILDEIGRGTSTYDGLSLAWALAEHFAKTKTRTLFATHFHELTALADKHTGIKNYNVAVKEWKDQIIFLHKIVPGSTDDSYGIYVAKLAGVPQKIIERAKQILTQLELKNDLKENLKAHPSHEAQLNLFSSKADPVIEEIKAVIKEMDVDNLTPLAALNKLQEWKEKFNEHKNT